MIIEERILNTKVLIVDDNILNVQILKKILQDAGFCQIYTTTDATQVLRLYDDLKPALLLLDYQMPQRNGIQLVSDLVQKYPQRYLPILMLTADEDPQVKIEAFQAGVKDFLHKPYERTEVLLRSRNIIEVFLLYKEHTDQNASLEEQVNQRTRELKETRLDVIHRLARMAEFRDKDTGLHILRMSRYCFALAKRAGLSDSQAELLLATSPLHDIGKVAIPDHILLKPGRVDPSEFEIIKTHTTVGAQLLGGSSSTFLKMASTIALYHHERWDGLGYPQQLKGDNIPLVARICAVCDVFDALTSKRPYKPAFTFEASLDELIKGRNTQFDPKLLDIFFDMKEEIRHIYDIYQ